MAGGRKSMRRHASQSIQGDGNKEDGGCHMNGSGRGLAGKANTERESRGHETSDSTT